MRIWAGAGAAAYGRLVGRGRLAFAPERVGGAARAGLGSLLNSGLGAVESVMRGGEVARTRPAAPVFVIGHWRSGTSLLHELLALHPALTAPTMFECCCPHHFLLTRDVFPRLLRGAVPDRRPGDDMRVAWGSPCEDEFALLLLGALSPYGTLAFPNRGGMEREMFDPDSFPTRERERWRRAMARFAAKVAVRARGRRIVFKSPPHTCRIPTLLALFEDASFVHVVRDPLEVFPSTMHLWRELRRTQSWQRPTNVGLQEMVLDLHEHLFEKLEQDRPLIPAGRFHEVRFEELVERPIEVVSRLATALDAEESAAHRMAMETYLDVRSDYRRNHLRVSDAERDLVASRWGDVAERYGYARATVHA